MLYVDGIMGEEINVADKKLDSALTKKWDREYSEICGYIRDRLSLNLVHASILPVWGPHSGKPWQSRHMPADGLEALRLET